MKEMKVHSERSVEVGDGHWWCVLEVLKVLKVSVSKSRNELRLICAPRFEKFSHCRQRPSRGLTGLVAIFVEHLTIGGAHLTECPQ
jgi:hypothetical protein